MKHIYTMKGVEWWMINCLTLTNLSSSSHIFITSKKQKKKQNVKYSISFHRQNKKSQNILIFFFQKSRIFLSSGYSWCMDNMTVCPILVGYLNVRCRPYKYHNRILNPVASVCSNEWFNHKRWTYLAWKKIMLRVETHPLYLPTLASLNLKPYYQMKR